MKKHERIRAADNRARYGFVDWLRGITLLSMIAYHFCWDAVNLYGAKWTWFASEGVYIWQQSICWSFLLLSGFSWRLGNHAFRRGLTVLAASGVISLVTWLVTPKQPIYFGVLTLIGSGMLLLILLDRVFRKVPSAVGFAASMLLFVFFRNAKDGWFGFEYWNIAKVPEIFYQNMFTSYLGFPPENFYSADYFPLFPWLFLFFAGYFLFGIWRKHSHRQPAAHKQSAIDILGQHTLPIYLIHQPIISLVLIALTSIGG